MRVVFFVQGEAVPAARARGFAVAGALQKAGLDCDVRVPRPSVYGDTRLPPPWNRPRPLYAPFAAVSRLNHIRQLREDDVVYLQRPLLELPIVALERWAARGRRVIFDFDDAIFERWGAPRKFRALVALADRVVAGSGYLAAAAAAPEKTTVIPTVVDTDRWREQPPRPTRGADVTIGWTGLSNNYTQLAHAAGGIARALERTGARFVVISDRPPPAALAPLRPEFVRWRPETEVEDLCRLDIGVMPLPDGPIERGKCAYKLIQYMALGRPGVASPVGANVEVVTPAPGSVPGSAAGSAINGYLPGDDQGWEEALVELVQDPGLRATVGRRARTRVEGAYSLRAVIPRYLDVLTNW